MKPAGAAATTGRESRLGDGVEEATCIAALENRDERPRQNSSGKEMTAVGVGLGAPGMGVGTGVEGIVTCTSTAPISQMAEPLLSPSTGRGKPRWSVVGQPVLVPRSMAGLPVRGRKVAVGPPFSARAPSRGFELFWSPGPARAHEASLAGSAGRNGAGAVAAGGAVND